MIQHSPDLRSQPALDAFTLSLRPEDVFALHYELEDGRLILEGRVPSYEAKSRIDAAAHQSGFRVLNCLRITPGIVSFSQPAPQQGGAAEVAPQFT